jgi:hypothetical protein
MFNAYARHSSHIVSLADQTTTLQRYRLGRKGSTHMEEQHVPSPWNVEVPTNLLESHQ